jgi:hypothetical protein
MFVSASIFISKKKSKTFNAQEEIREKKKFPSLQASKAKINLAHVFPWKRCA